MKKVLHIDPNDILILDELTKMGYHNEEDYTSTKEEIEDRIAAYEGIIIRTRFDIDKHFIDKATNLKFIARVGAGLESIDCAYAEHKGITLISAPEGNSTAVGEHAIGMLLSLMNKLNLADQEVRKGIWNREGNRGYEIEGKTVGIIGYGNMGNAFAKRLQGFDCEVICYDIKPKVGNAFAQQVSLNEFQEKVDILSLHTPQTPETLNMINTEFINGFSKPFWFVNTARGKSVNTDDLVQALKSGKIIGAALDVLENEQTSFENMFLNQELIPESIKYLTQSKKVILSPHVAGWTFESKEKLAKTIVDKIRALKKREA